MSGARPVEQTGVSRGGRGGAAWRRPAASPEEFLALGEAVGLAFLLAAVPWVGYLAVEPHFRRHWPTQLVTWSRLLEGKVGDPMVSRHVLVGVLVALLAASIQGTVPSPDRYLSGHRSPADGGADHHL